MSDTVDLANAIGAVIFLTFVAIALIWSYTSIKLARIKYKKYEEK